MCCAFHLTYFIQQPLVGDKIADVLAVSLLNGGEGRAIKPVLNSPETVRIFLILDFFRF